MIPSAAPFGGAGRSGMGAYHGSITGTAAPPFGNSLRLGANVALRVARLRTHRRLKRRDANSA
jgi:coniferyl-aldehyde dehydrogenase